MPVRIPTYQQQTTGARGASVQQPRSAPVTVADKTGQQLSGVGQDMSEIGQNLAAAQARVQSRAEAIARARGVNAYSAEAQDTLTRFMTEKDFTTPEAVAEYNTFLRERKGKLVQEYRGSEEGRLMLVERLDQEQFKFLSQASTASAGAQRKMVEGIMGSKTDTLANGAYQNPASIVANFNALNDEIALMAPALEPHEEQLYRRVGQEKILSSAIESFMDRGQMDEAERLLDETPGLHEILSRETFTKLQGRLQIAKAKEQEGATAGLRARAELRAALGREPTEDEMRQKMGVVGQTKLKAIADPTSPTGERFVSEQDALGKPAPGNKPIVSITQLGESEFVKQVGKNDADRLKDIEKSAQEAFRTKAEVDRMEAAISSGEFTTGVFSGALVFAARLGDRLGISDDIKGLVGSAATADTLDAASNRIAIEQAQKMSRVTNMSLTFVKDAVPNLMRTPEGNTILLEVMRRTADREIQIAQIADEMTSGSNPTLRPQDKPSFFQRVRDLEENDPVITPELRAKITGTAAKAPKSWKEVFQDMTADNTTPPKGYTPPKGWTFVRMEGNKPVIKNKQGQTAIGPEFKPLGGKK